MKHLLLLALLFIIAITVPFVRADDEDDESLAGQTATFTHIFPLHPSNILTQDEKVEVLIGMKNNAKSSLAHVKSISAYFSPESDYDTVLRNLTKYQYEVDVKPGDEITIPYFFIPEIEPMNNVGFVVVVDYFDSGEHMVHGKAVNVNVSVVVNDSVFDLHSIFLYVLIATGLFYGSKYAMSGGSGASSSTSSTKKAKKDNSVKKAATETASKVVDEDEWIPDHLKPSGGAKKSPRGGKKNK